MRQNFIDVLVLELNSYPKLLPVDINNYLSRIIGRNIKQNSLYICLYTPWILVIIYYQRTSHCKRDISTSSKPPVLKLAAIVLLEPAPTQSRLQHFLFPRPLPMPCLHEPAAESPTSSPVATTSGSGVGGDASPSGTRRQITHLRHRRRMQQGCA